MLQQNWFADPKFEMFEDYGDVQSFYDTETKNIYVVMEDYGQKGSNTIQEITPDSEEYAPNYEKYKAYVESKPNVFMDIVHEICAMTSTNCKSLNKTDLARKLMDIVNIPQEAEISEIPLDWDNQVEICFVLPDDDNYYSLYAGHWLDNTESMKLAIIGKVKGDKFDFMDKEKELSLDYFAKFTKDELSTLSNGLLCLIENINNAEKLIYDEKNIDELEKLKNKYRELNQKVCKMMS